MRKIIFSLLIVYGTILQLSAQLPYNWVPNYSFENGTFGFPCSNNFSPSNWNQLPNHGTPDWLSFSQSLYCHPTFDCPDNILDGDKRIFIGKNFQSPDGEAVIAPLSYTLEVGVKYKFRIWAVGRPLDYFSVHLTKKNDDSWANDAMTYAMIGTIPAFTYNFPDPICEGFVFENIITIVKPDLKYIMIDTYNGTDGNCFFELDNVELYPYCTEWMLRQNRIYRWPEEKEEAGYIYSGKNVATQYGFAQGEVHMFDGSKTTYKAYTEVSLQPGTTIDRGADFLARIAPCGKECQPPDGTAGTPQSPCNGESITLGSSPRLHLSYSWSSIPSTAISYLSNTNTSNPVFTAPLTGKGSIKYIVTITNLCGETTQREVIISYDREPNPIPDFSIGTSELASETPSFTVSVDPHTEKVLIQLIDCNGNIIKEYPPYFNYLDIINNSINFQFNDFVDPCGCYKFKIISKNYCYNTLKEQILNWNRNTTFQATPINNVVDVGSSTNNKFCINTRGTTNINFTLYDSHGQAVFSFNGPVTSNPMCFTLPSWLCGTYYCTIYYTDCQGTIHSQPATIQVVGCTEGLLSNISGDSSGLSGIDQNTQFMNADGVLDSLYSSIAPNPVTENATISYHLPENGHVKVSVCNSNFEQLSLLVNEEKQGGSYSTTILGSDFPFGPNYYMIEFTGTKTARQIRRFSVIH